MAIIRVEIAKRTQEVREAIIKGITEVMVANGALSEGTQVIIHEVEMTTWGKGGRTFDARMKEQASQAASAEAAAGDQQDAG
jgi:phenylpyruvate tautomerase PptA (4-oxalocrotonate tautomerase family)